MIAVLRAVDQRRMKWKNGAGETIEVACAPMGASLDDFDWRISTAHVAAAGPFSRFPGIDRSLAVLEGAGIVLDVAGNAPATLRQGTPPHAFDGGIVASATLLDGGITDLNVMTRRGRYRHLLTARRIVGRVHVACGGNRFVVLARGAMVLDTDAGQVILECGDAMEGDGQDFTAEAEAADLWLAEFWRVTKRP